jgi:serine/threonine-protein kinase Chk2
MTADYQTILEDYSSNGTFVNGKKIGKGKNKLLTHGDKIAMTCPKGEIFTYLDTQYRNPGFPSDINKKFVIAENLGKGYFLFDVLIFPVFDVDKFILCRSFGEVWLSVHKKSNKKYAIKSVRRQPNDFNEFKRTQAMEQLKNESELLCTLEHPGIVKVLLLLSFLYYGIVLKSQYI